MHIALISVAPPYRGGISKHSSILTIKLRYTCHVDLINYSRQYPNFLFPGKTQYIENELHQNEGDRSIDSINPITWYNTGKKIAEKKYDLVIFRFWNPFFSPALGIIAVQIKKKSPKTKLISLCDNILPHENIFLGRFFTSYFFHKMDGHIVQSSIVERELHEIIKNPIYEKCLHPIYDSFPSKIAKDKARSFLKLQNKYIILFFGIIRDYKGLDILLQATSILKDKMEDFHVLILGECYENTEKYSKLIIELEIDDLITWYNQYIPDEDVVRYFSAADIVALPYRSASQSGIVQIAYHYDLPVIVSKVGGLPEVVEEKKSGFIIKKESPEELTNVLLENLDCEKLDKMSNYIKNYKKKYSWETFIEGIKKVYHRL